MATTEQCTTEVKGDEQSFEKTGQNGIGEETPISVGSPGQMKELLTRLTAEKFPNEKPTLEAWAKRIVSQVSHCLEMPHSWEREALFEWIVDYYDRDVHVLGEFGKGAIFGGLYASWDFGKRNHYQHKTIISEEKHNELLQDWNKDSFKVFRPFHAELKRIQADATAKRLAEERRAQEEAFINEYEASFVKGGEYSPDLITGLVPAKQSMVVGASMKGGKTLLTAQLSAALVTAKPFLGFQTPRPVKVLVITLETTISNWMKWFEKGLRSYGIDIDNGGDADIHLDRRIYVQNVMPRDAKQWQKFASMVKHFQYEAVIIDPWSKAGDAQSFDQVNQAKAVEAITRPIIDAGATPIICAHFTKDIGPGDEPSLRCLAGSGPAQDARAWILTNRKEEYDFSGVHRLKVTTGMHGTGGNFDLDINEHDWTFERAGSKWTAAITSSNLDDETAKPETTKPLIGWGKLNKRGA